MGTSLKLLMVEDSNDDAELLLYTLRRGGYDVTWQRVDTSDAMRAALLEAQWDIITSDHAMPRFSAPAALTLARQLRPEIPLIIVSGEIDINLAVSLMKSGAQDYIQKGELARVVPAIERELNDAASRRRQRETEEILYRQQLLMARIYDTSPVGITMVDASGQITFANREAERVLGLTKNAITQRTYNSPTWHITTFDGDPFPEEELPFARVMRTGQPVRDVRHAIEWPDGRCVLLSINAAPLTDDTGALNGMVATLHDITDQIKVAESLRVSEARFRTLVNSMDDIVFTLDLQGRHTGVFGSWVERIGLTPKDFLGRTACEIMGDEAGYVHQNACQRAVQGETVVYDWSALMPGSGQKYYQTSLSPIYDGGRVTGVVGVGRDVTELKCVEDALRVREAQLRASLENTPNVAVQWYDRDGRVVYWNPASEHLYGWSAADAMGKTLDQLLYTSEENAAFIAHLQHIAETGEAVEPYESTFCRRDGSEGIILSTQFALPSEADRPLFVCIDVDITARKQSQKNLETLFNTIDDLLFVLDMQGNITHMNQAVCRKLGFTADELIGQSVLLVHPPERREEAAQIVASMVMGKTVTCPVPLIAKDGHQIPVETRVMAGEWDGKAALFGITRDISALQLSEEKFARAFHSGSALMAISTIADGRYIEVNEAFLKMTGYTRQDVIGNTSQALNFFVSPVDRERARREVQEKGYIENIETHVRRKDGEILVGIFSVNPIQIGGEPCWLTAMTDITDRIHAEQELQKAKKLYQDLVETAQDLIWQCDNEGRYTYLNPAWENVFGYSLDEMLGRKFTDFQTPEIAQRDLEKFRDLMRGDTVKGYQTTHLAKNGTPILLSFNAKFVRDETGKIVGTCGTAYDITEQKHFIDALQDSDRRFHEFMRHFPGLAYIKDAESRSLFANEGFLTYLGLDPIQILGKTNDELFPSDFAKRLDADDQFVLNTGQSIEIEEQFAGRIWSTHKFLIPRGENPPLLGGATLDITERRQAETERDRIFNYSMDMLCMVDANGCFRLLNPAWKKTLGWSAEDMLGRHYLDFVHPDDQQITVQIAEAQTQGMDVNKYENRYRSIDGSYKWLSWNSVAVEEGQEVFAVARDVTEQKVISEALRESEERYRHLFTTMQTGFALHEVICDAAGEPVDYRFLEINPAFEQLTGIKASDLIGKTVLEMMPGTEVYWIKTYGKVALSGQPTLVNNYSSDLGKYYEGIAYCPKPGQFAVMFSDITERRKIELALRQSEERYRSLVEQSPDGIVVHCDGLLQYVNPAAVRLLRAHTSGELIGQRAINFVHPEQRAMAFERIQQMMSSGEPAPLADEKFLRLDGSVVDVEVAAIPTQYDGKPAVQVIFREITRRKQAEISLMQSEQRFRRTFDEAPVGALLVSPRMEFLRVNRAFCQWLGYSESELLQKNMVLITHPDDVLSSKQNIQALLEGHIEQFEMEKRYLCKDGQVVWGRVSVVLLRDEVGNPLYFLPMIQDISQAKRSELEIRQLNADLEQRVRERTKQFEAANKDLELANRELESFTYSVSHDLRAPLRGIDGYSQILLDGYRDVLDDDGLHYLTRLRESAQWTTRLVNDLLGLSRFSRVHITLSQVNLSELAQAIIGELRESQPERDVQVSIAPDLQVHGDANLLRVVLDNLLRNAWKFTSKRPAACIEFGCCETNNETTYFIRDNGAGFDMRYAEKLFTVFQRLHTEAEFEGTGIGLTIVQRIIHRHGGRVWAEGTLDQGATFYFTLPGKES
jgi:PAS domain S-box-containing protein